MNLSSLSKWLRKTPQPAVILLDDGKRIDVGTRGGRWSEIARSIEAIGASKVTALDGQGNILRAVTLAADDDDDEKPSKDDRESHCCPTCGVSLDRFATLLADAYDRGSNSQKSAYQSIFQENTNLVRLLADRLGALEVAWQKSLQSYARLTQDLALAEAEAQAARIATSPSDEVQLLSAITTGMQQAQAAEQQNGRKKADK